MQPAGEVRALVVVPALNEAGTIREVVERAKRHADVCVVDDGSVDDTGALASAVGAAHVLRHERNTHIAGAILDGFRWALEKDYTHCVTMDAGLSHEPEAIPAFLAHARADLVLGYRQELSNVPLRRRLLSRAACQLMNLALDRRRVPWGGTRFRDATSGYRLYSRQACELLVRAPMGCRAFDFHIEALAWVYRAGFRIEEIPIRYAFTNSSLRPTVVREALRTCLRIWSSELVAPAQSQTR
jgi:dolichol-phosphate mannosyltransferase